GYLLSADRTTCTALIVENCRHYVLDLGRIRCNQCEDGFTLSEDRTQCLEGCSIENCQTCVIIDGVDWCWECKKGFIGTYNTSNFQYAECLSCDEWRAELVVEEGRNESSKKESSKKEYKKY